jgi:phosphoglycolate phosphatase
MGISLTTKATAFIFDFDGTLVDSEQAIYQCFQKITKQLAPERMEHAKNILIGPTLKDTASEILGLNHRHLQDKFVQLFIKMHDEQVIKHTQPYPGVNQVLKQLHQKNIPMAVATNKRLAPTQKLINHFKWNTYFEYTECSDSQAKIRNKDDMIKDIIKKNPLFHHSFFIGDTVNDGLSSNLNELKFVRANYGYGKKENWEKVKIYNVINDIKEILEK